MHTTKNYLKIKPLRNASLSDDDYSTDYSLWGRGLDMVKPDRSWKFLIQYRRMRCWFRIIVNDNPQHFSVAQWKKSEIIQNIEFLPLRNSLTATASKTRERELWRQRRRRKINWKFAPQTPHWQLHHHWSTIVRLLCPCVNPKPMSLLAKLTNFLHIFFLPPNTTVYVSLSYFRCLTK